jgi:hypothetical protein
MDNTFRQMIGIEPSYLSDKERAQAEESLRQRYPWLEEQKAALDAIQEQIQKLENNEDVTEEVRGQLAALLTQVRLFVFRAVEGAECTVARQHAMEINRTRMKTVVPNIQMDYGKDMAQERVHEELLLKALQDFSALLKIFAAPENRR